MIVVLYKLPNQPWQVRECSSDDKFDAFSKQLLRGGASFLTMPSRAEAEAEAKRLNGGTGGH